MAIELAYPNPIFDEPIAAVAVLMASVPGFLSPLLEEGQRLGLMPPDQPRDFAILPYTVAPMRLQNVLDLRFPDAQRWLFETFAAGDGEWVTFLGTKLPKEEGFCGLLPTLMARDNGGNGFTDVIGSYLRHHGVEALVFPAARSDVFTHFVNAELIESGGWNLVDYRGFTEDVPKRHTIWTTDWERFWDPRTQVAQAGVDSSNAGSIHVRGNEEHHRLLRHLSLCCSVWEKAGHDMAVTGHRWHTTRSILSGDKRVVSVTCGRCNHEIPRVEALYDIPDVCPACGLSGIGLP
jgi:hypothetical protein